MRMLTEVIGRLIVQTDEFTKCIWYQQIADCMFCVWINEFSFATFFANFFESNDIVYDYNLRNNRNIKLFQLTTNVRFFSINVTDLEFWNDVDISIRDVRHVDIFKVN